MHTKIKTTLKMKRVTYLFLVALLILLTVALNLTFSAFTNKKENVIANIKVKDMSYNIKINGVDDTKMTANANKTTTGNVSITSLNSIDSKYELIYKVCATSTCTSFINKPAGLTVEYSSRTVDPVNGSIIKSGLKQIRIIVTNTSATTYYIQLGINAGYIHNTLALQNLITAEYNEEDVTVAALINGEVSTTFPTTNIYDATVSCLVNGKSSVATPTIGWNGSKWLLNVTGIDTGRTVCNVNFNNNCFDENCFSQKNNN